MTILILANNGSGLYLFRKELLTRLITEKNNVYCSLPFSDMTEQIEKLAVNVINTEISRHGTNPFEDIKYFITV